jgi:hypothetical protein
MGFSRVFKVSDSVADGDFCVFGGSEDQVRALLARDVFVTRYCAEHQLDKKDLSFDQIFEIRRQPEWQNPLEYAVGKELFQTECPKCGRSHTWMLDAIKVREWRENKKLVQVVFPELSNAEREELITGLCGGCWIVVFGPEDANA